MSRFHQILKEYWSYDQFRPLQEEIIISVAQGKDTLGLMPTGGGKSLTFQVPTMAMEGICLVVTPLIALMKDQVDNLKKKGIKATAVYSGMSRQEIITNLENCVFGNYKFLYISPERLSTELFLAKLHYMNVCMLVIDESHCISQWGYDFRPAYLKIADIRSHLPNVPVLALTATATAEVVEDIQDKLLFKHKNVFKKSFERDNVAYIVRKTEDKLFEISNIFSKVPGSGLLYVRSRKRTKEIAIELQRQGIKADFFHAGLNSEEKNSKQNQWKENEIRIMVCTNAFGMGIDKPDVRVVIHYEMPDSIEEYFQEAGRAGRDEEKAYAIVIYSERDSAKLIKRVKDEFPERKFIKEVYEKLAYYLQIAEGSGFQTSHNFDLQMFCTNFKLSFTQVHNALKLLQLAGYIEYNEEVDKQSRLLFTTSRDDLYRYKDFNPQAENLLQIILRLYSGMFAEYISINEGILSTRTGMNRQEIYDTLKMLAAQQIISFIPAKKTPTITYSQNREDIKYMNIPIAVYETRKNKLENRIKSIIEYGASTTTCRSRILLSYFGENKNNDCGQCDVCLKKKHSSLNNYQYNIIANEIRSRIKKTDSPIPVSDFFDKLPFSTEQIITCVRFLADANEIGLENEFILKIK
ncbi:ATP-dependent DNA helicase RecQ [Bacteroidales bacterium]|nr:ATP-dependent DNA helicase RecQ [Bacteroidales bacterium]